MRRCRDAGGRTAGTLGIVVLLISACTNTPQEAEEPSPTQAVTTAPVLRQDLTTEDVLAGWLGYGEARPVMAGGEGTVTRLPEAGDVIGRGEMIAKIDGIAARVLYGKTPVWRRLAYGVSGADVKQLNDNLAEMGYADRDDLSKSKFDWRTRRAVCAWQQDLKLRRTGVLEPGEIVFLPGQVRVGSVDAALGSMVGPGAALISVTGTDQIVTIDLDAALRGTLNEGLAVEVVLPDRTQLDATVASIGRTITGSTDPDAETEPTVKVAVELDGDADELDASPVSVVVERVLVADALAVPVGALVARPGGGYAVERKTAGGVELVPVEPGQFSDGLVEVTGDIAEGDEVVVPS